MRRSRDSRVPAKRFVVPLSWRAVSRLARSSTLTRYWASSTYTNGLFFWASMKGGTRSRSSGHSNQFPNEKTSSKNRCAGDGFHGARAHYSGCPEIPIGRDIKETDHHGLQGSELRLLQKLGRASGQTWLSRRHEGHASNGGDQADSWSSWRNQSVSHGYREWISDRRPRASTGHRSAARAEAAHRGAGRPWDADGISGNGGCGHAAISSPHIRQKREDNGLREPLTNRYFLTPGISIPPWCRISRVTFPAESFSKVICASTSLRKNSVGDSANT